MSRAEKVIAAAESWIGTPYVQQGRLKGVGCDCIGLVIGVGVDALVVPADVAVPAYRQSLDIPAARKHLAGRLRILKRKEPRAGDVLIFRVGRRDHAHFAIFDGERMIHASNHAGRVIRSALDDRWLKKLAHCCRYRSLVDG